MGDHEVSDPLGERRTAARDHVVTTQRLLERTPLSVGEANEDSVLTGMRCLRSPTLRHRFSDITISENRSASKLVSTTSACHRGLVPQLLTAWWWHPACHWCACSESRVP